MAGHFHVLAAQPPVICEGPCLDFGWRQGGTHLAYYEALAGERVCFSCGEKAQCHTLS